MDITAKAFYLLYVYIVNGREMQRLVYHFALLDSDNDA